MTSPSGAKPPLVVWSLIAVSACLMAVWSIVIPVYEAPDEPHHWRVARYLHDHRALPLYDARLVEANQPPVYYALVAPLARSGEEPSQAAWIDGTDTLTVPFAPRFYINSADAFERYRGLRAARLLTALLSAAGLLFVYLTAFEASGRRGVGLLALALVGFLPQFTFRSGTISNDTLVATFGALTTWLTVRLARRGFAWRDGLGAAAALAAAYLTKISAISLGPPLAMALMLGGGSWQVRLRRLWPLLVTAMLVAPWSVRNQLLYGDVFASGAMRSAVPAILDPKPITSPYFTTVFPDVLGRSFVGLFGWLNVALPAWGYWFFALLGVAAGAGMLRALLVDRGTRRAYAILLATIALQLAIVVHINLTFSQPQGRYLFPSVGAIGAAAAAGLSALPAGRLRMPGGVMVAAFVFLLNAYTVLRVVIPAYYPSVVPRVSTVSLQPPGVRPVHLVERDGRYFAGGPDGQLILDFPFCSVDVSFLSFELQGGDGGRTIVGNVYFGRPDAPMGEAQRVEFRWKADGRKRRIIVPLASNPHWRGLITEVRVQPVSTPTAPGMPDVWFTLAVARLQGSI